VRSPLTELSPDQFARLKRLIDVTKPVSGASPRRVATTAASL
jgi:hypothetical protein